MPSTPRGILSYNSYGLVTYVKPYQNPVSGSINRDKTKIPAEFLFKSFVTADNGVLVTYYGQSCYIKASLMDDIRERSEAASVSKEKLRKQLEVKIMGRNVQRIQELKGT